MRGEKDRAQLGKRRDRLIQAGLMHDLWWALWTGYYLLLLLPLLPALAAATAAAAQQCTDQGNISRIHVQLVWLEI